MQHLKRILMLAIAMQASFFALGAELEQQSTSVIDKSSHHSNHCGPVGPQGPIGPQGDPRVSFGNYASFFLTTGADVTIGDNVIFNSQVALLGIEYDNTTGVFTLSPGTYSVTYLFEPFETPPINMYVNDQLILNSPLGGNSTVLTLTEPTNTLTLQYIATGTFTAPDANQSRVSIAIFQID